MRKLLLLAVFVALTGIGATLFVSLGIYNIAATEQHTAPVYLLAGKTMLKSVQQRGDEIPVPDLSASDRVARGLHLYRTHCRQCHGAPGEAPDSFALGMTPVPANLVHTARTWKPGWIFWVAKYGVKMTGMPAWKYRMSDQELWDIVAFIKILPTLSPADYRRMVAERQTTTETTGASVSSATSDSPGDPRAGKQAMGQYACPTCHEIPGIVGASKPVGPPLKAMAKRRFIAGLLPNNPENMVRWIMHPQRVDPDSAMPNLGVTEQDARDMAAYLATLTKP